MVPQKFQFHFRSRDIYGSICCFPYITLYQYHDTRVRTYEPSPQVLYSTKVYTLCTTVPHCWLS